MLADYNEMRANAVAIIADWHMNRIVDIKQFIKIIYRENVHAGELWLLIHFYNNAIVSIKQMLDGIIKALARLHITIIANSHDGS